MNKNSKIFVAGGTGLVGSAIIKNLIYKGYENIIASYNNRKPITNNQLPITWKKLDLINQKAVENFFEKEKPEYVILAAAKVGGIVANNTYRADFIYENLQIQNNVIHQSYIHKVKKLLFLGSTCIYPKNAPQPMSEECLLTSPLEYTNEPYAIAKIAGIKMCESYNIQYGTNFISVMPTNLYGPNDNFNLETSHVLPALMRKIHLGKCLESVKWEALSAKNDKNWELIKQDLNKNPIEGISGENTKEEILDILEKYGIKLLKTSIEIWGSGNPKREFLWSEDMADACVFIMEKINFSDIVDSQITNTQYTNIPITNTHINIGTGIDISIKELAELIKKVIGFQGQLIFNTQKLDGTMLKRTDVTKLHSLGWKHKIELDEGIKLMYEWYKNATK
jgi:GDP-L-fucose synthase